MRFEHKVTIAAPRERVWAFLMDVPAVGRCVPGVESVEALGDDQYQGTMKVRVGPIGLTLQGKLGIVEQDATGGRATLRAEAADRRVGGGVHATMTMQVVDQGQQATELTVTTDASMLGRLGEFGMPVIRKKADQTMEEFARNVQRAIAG